MPMTKERLARLLATLRKNPEFASHMLQGLPEETRRAVLDAMAKPEATAPASPRPGLQKCGAASRVPTNGFSAQLNSFARSVSRVA